MFRSATGSTLHLLLESQLVGRCAREDLSVYRGGVRSRGKRSREPEQAGDRAAGCPRGSEVK